MIGFFGFINNLNNNSQQPFVYNLNGIENNQELISTLKFIGNIQKGEKINTKKLYIQQEGFLTSVSRTIFNQDNRWNTKALIEHTMSKCFSLLDYYEKSKDSENLNFRFLINDLIQAQKGIENIKLTYIHDAKFSCDIITILQTITIKLKHIHNKFPELFENVKINPIENKDHFNDEKNEILIK
jgi:hypothetical protein